MVYRLQDRLRHPFWQRKTKWRLRFPPRILSLQKAYTCVVCRYTSSFAWFVVNARMLISASYIVPAKSIHLRCLPIHPLHSLRSLKYDAYIRHVHCPYLNIYTCVVCRYTSFSPCNPFTKGLKGVDYRI